VNVGGNYKSDKSISCVLNQLRYLRCHQRITRVWDNVATISLLNSQ